VIAAPVALGIQRLERSGIVAIILIAGNLSVADLEITIQVENIDQGRNKMYSDDSDLRRAPGKLVSRYRVDHAGNAALAKAQSRQQETFEQKILKHLDGARSSGANWFDTYAKDPLTEDACQFVGWILSAPCAQWDYYHCITEEGGIIPLNFSALRAKFVEKCKLNG
jgi:hypothetical protein